MSGTNFNTRNFLKSDAQQVDQIKQNLDRSISSRNKIEEQTNRDLLDTFLISKNSVHIDNAAEDIKTNREHQEQSDSKVNVISGINSTITFKGKQLQKQDHPEIYRQYNEILKDEKLSAQEKSEKLEFLDRLIASRASLMTANESIMYGFKRRIYFSTSENRNEIFTELNKVEPFKGKIEMTDQDLSGEMHYIIKRKDEITKRKQTPKPIKPNPTPKPVKPELTGDDTNIDIDTDSGSNSKGGNSEAHAKSKIGDITQTVEVNNDTLAEALIKINEQNQKTIKVLIEALNDNKNNNTQENNQKVTINEGTNYGPTTPIPYYGTMPGSFYNAFNNNDLFLKFMAMMMQQQSTNNNSNNRNVGGGGNNGNNEVSIMLMMKEMFEKMKIELSQEIENKYGDISIKMKKSYNKIKKIIKDIDINNFDPEEIKKIIQEELSIFKTGIVKDIKEEIEKIKLQSNEDLKKLEEKSDKGFSDMKTEFTTLKDNVNNRFNQLDTKLQAIEGKIKDIDNELKLVNQKIKLMGNNIKDLKEQQKKLLEELKELHEEHDNIMKELADIKKMIEECCEGKNLDDDNNDNDPIPTPNTHEVEQEAIISNVTEVSREEAEKIAENELREKYGNMSWLNLKKYWYFYAREYITKNRTQKIMNSDGRKGLNRGDKFVDGADRHGLEFANKLDVIDEVLAITQEKFPDTHYRINELAKNFMGNAPYHATMTQAEFQQKFQDIIEHNPPYDNNVQPSIKKVMQQNNMQKISSNIFHQVDAFRANKALVYDMADYIGQKHTADELKNHFRPKIAQYIKDYASIPAFMKRFENLTGEKLGIDNPEMYNNIMKHTYALANIQADTLNLNMKLINRGRAAYKVDQEHGNTTKMGKRLDRPFAKWIDNAQTSGGRGFRNTLSIFTKTAFQAGPVLGLGMIGGTLVGGPLGTAIGVGIGVGAKTLLAKFAHTTKEHEGHLRDQARDFQRTSAYRQRMFDAVNNGEYKRYHKILPNRKGVEYRNFLRYIKTSHNELINSEAQSADILQLAQKEEILTSIEKQELKEKVAKALARLDLYKETGQNFFGSDNESVAEKEFRDIKQAVLLGKARIGYSLDGIRTETRYRQEKNILENQYNAVWKNFKKMRRNVARKGAIKTGAIAGGMSYLASSALSGNETTSGITETQHTINPSGHWNPGENLENHFISGDVDTPLKTTISNPNYASGKFEITAGVDEMMLHNVAGAKADLASKISSVDSYIKSHFSGTNEKTLLDAFNPNTLAKIQKDAIAAGVDQGNASLLANRYVEGIEEIAKAHVEAGKVDSPITEISSKIIHQPSVARAAGNVDFRTMGVKMEYINQEAWEKVISHQRNIPGGEWVDNTFKMGKDQENDAPHS